MRGLELAKAYYEAYGAEWIRREFPDYEDRIAVGLAGQGSECFGYDDDLSRDHDFGPGFCLWITKEDEQAAGFRLMRGYKKLPDTFQGVTRQAVSLFGGGRWGVHGIGEFYESLIGAPGVPESPAQWLAIPEYALASAVNGQVFRDGLGEFSRIRETLLRGYPEDVRRKKIAARAAVMAQAGQYNFLRCVRRGEYGAAALALSEFVTASVSMLHLLERRYTPYYKWMFRSLRSLPDGGSEADRLEALLTGPVSEASAKDQAASVEAVSASVIRRLKEQGLTRGDWDYLEPHAVEITERIKDPALRMMHVMEG